jgi:hypothetical protein
MHSRQELKVFNRDLLRFNPQFVLQLPLRCSFDAFNRTREIISNLPGNIKRVRTAAIRPQTGKSDLCACALLQQ